MSARRQVADHRPGLGEIGSSGLLPQGFLFDVKFLRDQMDESRKGYPGIGRRKYFCLLPQALNEFAAAQDSCIMGLPLSGRILFSRRPAQTAADQLIPPSFADSISNKLSVCPAGPFSAAAKQGENFIRLLALQLPFPHDDRMAGPGVGVQLLDAFRQAGPQRVEVDVADQFEEIRLFLADNGLVAILEKVAGPLVAKVEDHGIAGQKPAHESGKPCLPRPE